MKLEEFPFPKVHENDFAEPVDVFVKLMVAGGQAEKVFGVKSGTTCA